MSSKWAFHEFQCELAVSSNSSLGHLHGRQEAEQHSIFYSAKIFHLNIFAFHCNSTLSCLESGGPFVMKHPPIQTQTFFTLRTVSFTNIKQMFIEDKYAVFNVCKHLWTLNNHVINVCVLAGLPQFVGSDQDSTTGSETKCAIDIFPIGLLQKNWTPFGNQMVCCNWKSLAVLA